MGTSVATEHTLALGGGMRNGRLILLAMLGLLGCSGKHLLVGEDGAGAAAGAVGAAGGAAGSVTPSGTGGAGATASAGSSGGPGATTGSGGTVSQPIDAGTAVGGGLSVIPGAATFPSTLVEAVSAPQTFTVRNDGDVPVGTSTALSALVGTNAADFLITSNACGTTVQPGASCDVAVAFAPKTRSGLRSASLAVGAASTTAANVSLSGTALPSLGLLAGNLGGPGNRDGTGAGARFNQPVSVAGDGAGNLYVAEYTNQTIRKVVIATGAVTTLAGASGQHGATDGIGSAALFAGPSAIASDGAGNLYVADPGNEAIRKIVIATGLVSTFVGGQRGSANGSGTAAQFRSPYGIASDGAGNLYVADSDNDTIRKIVIATRAVTTVAGSATQTGSTDGTGAAARFYEPNSIASDGAGNLYVSDSGNYTIRRIVIATRAVTTLAGLAGVVGASDGTGTGASFGSLEGLASDGAGNLYAADQLNNNIRKIAIATGAVTTFAGSASESGAADGRGPAARFFRPNGVASDGAGNLFVADSFNNAIRKIAIATAAVTTLAGAPTRSASGPSTNWLDSLNYPSGIASDGTGNLYVADTNNSLIRKVDIATGTFTTLAGGSFAVPGADGTGTAANFGQPQGIAADRAGNLYVADTLNDTVRKIVIATGAVTTLTDGTGAAVRFSQPCGVVADGAGNLYVTELGNRDIVRVVIATGAFTIVAGAAGQSGSADGTGAGALFAEPRGIATDGAGNLYVADTSNATIRKIVIATGAVTTFSGTPGQQGAVDGIGANARFTSPWGLTSDGAGNLFVADTNSIRKIVIATAAVTTVAGTRDQTGTADGTGAAARFNDPCGIASDGAGNLYVADTLNNSIRKVATASGTVTTVAPSLAPSVDGTGGAARFTSPTGITGDGSGNLYVTDGNGTIRQIVAATRAVTTFAGAAGQQGNVDGIGVDARFTNPNAIFGDLTGNLFVADGVVIRQVTVPAGAVTTVAGTQNVWGVSNLFAGPTGVVSDGAGNLYVSDYGFETCECVRKVVIATGAVTLVAGGFDGAPVTTRFYGPKGIATDAAGNLYVTDGTSIQKIDTATGVVTTFAGMPSVGGIADGVGTAATFVGPSGIASDGAGTFYVVDGYAIRKIDIASATVSTIIGSFGQVGVSTGALPATLNTPVAVTVLPTGEIAIVDSIENAVLIGHL